MKRKIDMKDKHDRESKYECKHPQKSWASLYDRNIAKMGGFNKKRYCRIGISAKYKLAI